MQEEIAGIKGNLKRGNTCIANDETRLSKRPLRNNDEKRFMRYTTFINAREKIYATRTFACGYRVRVFFRSIVVDQIGYFA